MLKGGKISLTKDHVCKDKGICEVAVIDATERMADQAKTRAFAEPTLSAKVIAQEIMIAAHQEFNGIFYWTNIYYLECVISM